MLASDRAVPKSTNVEAISFRLTKLREAVVAGRSRLSCLRRWSEFIRERDGYRCVDCHSQEDLSAHHICRKSFFSAAQFDTGNGITLCRQCHKELHAGFNGRPNMLLPVDAEGGEKLGLMERLYSILLDDAVERGLMREDFYFLSDEILGFLRKMQGYEVDTYFPGSRLEQAYLILAVSERQVLRAIAEANGFVLDERPLLPGGAMEVLNDEGGLGSGCIVCQKYSPRFPAPDKSESDG
ncbi:HNH nuclease [Rhodomicrobium vannielii ATCC 17100]|uniref:HNH nuclease n=1 Tax=Rhodomicrobium vannielii (strain ATCC 17100 / DSM 162 / LMG 4299 / NCIMB 10020 / ATH 3.1.1) TaxID=648757 RepID=E3I785_RHOVT|nr:HNH endonuclease [Rhodomicrobium vannielii]ADP70736.1 HNH nuclease [Rhodomicrobium vannielii ATCC 17100]